MFNYFGINDTSTLNVQGKKKKKTKNRTFRIKKKRKKNIHFIGIIKNLFQALIRSYKFNIL